MSHFNIVPDYFIRRDWNQTWDVPSTGSLIDLEKVYSSFYFSWETNYTPWTAVSFARNHYWMGTVFTLLYLLFIWLGSKYMENRKPFDLRAQLKYWNLLLAVFSICGTLRTVPYVFYLISKVGFMESLCIPPIWTYSSGSCGFWVMVFVFSKYFELIDTVFIILRKKPLSFLHWYHHATVLISTWEVFIGDHPPVLHFCAMNYTVHAIMYFYYYLAAISSPPKWGVVVTALQIMQMIVGFTIGCITLYFSYMYRFIPHTTTSNALKPFDIPGCYILRSNLLLSVILYLSYLYLFVAFFCRRYVSSPAVPGKKTHIKKGD